eukprot:CAMPEP_0177702186 /NCGR_PEP_ID=MMETSP0484_2-20121128/7005_1 /TAXON_ID=354590 /ORGANISM="Rhodomonas lens, Strain RHODO" /LENGTH=54 /DNA_ID=CAMNT_0019213459 /DNA_START=153 /DNA_END=317 /DNA_ORIENTATION=+
MSPPSTSARLRTACPSLHLHVALMFSGKRLKRNARIPKASIGLLPKKYASTVCD